ncbi:MAG: molybdopterin cofactor-binding domain-containing protein [Mesotoga sp.]|uniref:xanthine dehydrogenase family protein molybdopterin-binding subunit n=2 Tax=Mesotoga sp. TaxID=2053577 RepID=UPI00260AC36F|nr:molybdopterin cofactor-binding domain-containing protein [Mesotoga sp.]MDD4207507.1 molybdopterin-dependent oxidoreductase [Mesotoga sp.]MDD4825904.1 molybdopterin-dependent oxidoreductase [Mesotoga sp.]MDD5683770.1 molybdopterin-dependent oxidoreductase [Mesotoga sp.]
MSEHFKTVGRPEKKVDGLALVRGKPVYTPDYDAPDALVVKLLRSPHAHAQIKGIDTGQAEAINDVVGIFTFKDIDRIPFTRAGQGYPEPSPYDTYLLDSKVRYVGDVVAVVAAKNEKAAREAMKNIKVEYEILDPVFDMREASNEGAPVIHDEDDCSGVFDKSRNIAAHFVMDIGDVEKTLENCDFVLRKTYHVDTQLHAALEPHNALTYFDSVGRLIVVSSTQVPFHCRRILSHILKKPIADIRVIKPRIGGGFGGKQSIIVEPYAALVTIKTGMPARIVYGREEVSMGTNIRHEMSFDVAVGATKDGKIRAISLQGISNTGAYGEHCLTTFMVAGSKTLPLYNKVDAVHFGGDIVYTNLPPAGAYRGYGAPQGLFPLDCAIDELAHEMKMDPLKLKEMNSIREGETSPIFEIMGEGREGVPQIMRSCKLQECIDLGKKAIDWDSKRGKKTKNGTKVRGVGCALAMQGSGIPKIDMGAATIKMNEDGSFNLLVGATDLGTGSDTILGQIAAEVLTVPLDKIVVYSSDTDLTPFDVGAYASSTTYVSGNAVRLAAEKVKEKVLDLAAEYLERDRSELTLESGVIRGKDGSSVSLSELCTMHMYTFNQQQISESASYVGEESPPPFAASFAEVEVDTDTGKITLINYVSYADCGLALNPIQAMGQLEGASMQGIGWALYEDIIYAKNGRMLTNDFFTYKVPSRMDYGKLTCGLVDSYEPTGPFGAKSIGEIGIDTPIPAIANAIFDATGIRLRHAPFKSERVLFEILSMEV